MCFLTPLETNPNVFLRSNSSDNQANDCLRLLKHRAEYEMYADVILVSIISLNILSFH